MWGQVVDVQAVINHANFYLNRPKGYAPRGDRNLLYPIDLMYRPYNIVNTNVLHSVHCDITFCHLKFMQVVDTGIAPEVFDESLLDEPEPDPTLPEG